MVDELARRSASATSLRARIGLDLVVVAVDHQQRAADLAIHRLADIERRRDRPRLHGLDQHRAGGLARPVDAVLDLLGRVRLGEDVADEVLGEIRIVGEPVVAVVLVPALERLALRPGNACGAMYGIAWPDASPRCRPGWRPCTRSGWWAARMQASRPPNDRPTRIALPASVASMTASASAT